MKTYRGSNPGLLHCRQILYHMSYQGNPLVGKWMLFIRSFFQILNTYSHSYFFALKVPKGRALVRKVRRVRKPIRNRESGIRKEAHGSLLCMSSCSPTKLSTSFSYWILLVYWDFLTKPCSSSYQFSSSVQFVRSQQMSDTTELVCDW